MNQAFLLLVLGATLGGAASFGYAGRASGWLGAGCDTSFLGRAGLRYLPEARLVVPLGWELALDAEASANGFVSAAARRLDRPEVEARLKPYRALVRVSSPRFEARAGLQKINFGSATLLRPLQWFDRVDPRDPLELTDGVWGLLGRYYFQSNANLWAWGLVGNSSPKGWESRGSERWVPEFGGRGQLPVPRGEIAATYHHRRYFVPMPEVPERHVYEDRVGLDGKWDLGVGLAFEATLQRKQSGESGGAANWQRMATVGLDYTFGVGAGFGAAVEHLYTSYAVDFLATEVDANVSALLLNYPISLLDNVRALALYDWSGKKLYPYVAWQRTLDSWVFQVAGFWGPDEAAAPGSAAGMGAGKGVSLLVAYNH